MNLHDRADAAFDWIWQRCETSVAWFTAVVAAAGIALFGVGYGIVALIWR